MCLQNYDEYTKGKSVKNSDNNGQSYQRFHASCAKI